MIDIRIDLADRSYDVVVGAGVLRSAADHFAGAALDRLPLFIITDENVAAVQRIALDQIQALPVRKRVVTIPPGEGSKNILAFSHLLDELAAFEDGDGAVVVAIGGGVVGDLGGFVAACYKRGVPWVQVPTTLLAQVDSSVGGKVAINHPTAKNLIGAFHQPRLVLADMDTLESLPVRELRSGLAEVIKHGVIADRAFFDRVESTLPEALTLDRNVLTDYVATSCKIKGAAVEADERDTKGRRAFLNYGHTFGHAIELAAHFRYAHGEAVAIGMACAGDLAVASDKLDKGSAARIEAVLAAAGLPTSAEGLSVDEVMAAMRLDKKFQRGQNRFVIVRKIGNVELVEGLAEDRIVAVLKGRLR